jgi:hypothetical protein
MAYKNKEDAQRWYQEHKEEEVRKARARNIEYIKRNVEYITNLKENTPCKDCGQQYPYYVMHFDHLKDKMGHVATLARSPVSFKRLLIEISKCEIVCANCHAERTHQRGVA